MLEFGRFKKKDDLFDFLFIAKIILAIMNVAAWSYWVTLHDNLTRVRCIEILADG